MYTSRSTSVITVLILSVYVTVCMSVLSCSDKAALKLYKMLVY